MYRTHFEKFNCIYNIFESIVLLRPVRANYESMKLF